MVKEEYKDKDDLQSIDVEKVTEFFKALTEPRRILILEELQKEEHCICDFVKILGLSQPAVSHHISLLSRVGLIKTRKEGKKVICSLRDKKNINRLLQIAEKLIKS
ncbi:winged helix-turn-helix transcriptional regulator [Candidatus Bathyarchaeota archaeon]|nr:winged helix-turn-helix transcriptional regulator [Candidatus Bathyarchaeota archaeon]